MTPRPLLLTHSQSLIGVGHGAVTTLLSPLTGTAGALAGIALSKIVGWVLGAARSALLETAHVIGIATAPQLTSAWFSAEYWRVAGFAALVTVPFLCAAALQAVLRSDLTMLGQSVLFHLPVALIGVNLAAPVVMLLLAATDQLCAGVAGTGSVGFLTAAAATAGGLSALQGSPFLAAVVGILLAAAALALTLELLIREAAVYVVVLMLPLVFAGLVWPARRIWAIRLIELLIGLILSKFVVVAVLSLAGAALGGSGAGGPRLLTAMALIVLATMAPWAMLRLLPFTELAAGAADALSSHARRYADPLAVLSAVDPAVDMTMALSQRLRRGDDEGDATVSGEPATQPAPPLDEPPGADLPSASTASGGPPTPPTPTAPERQPEAAPSWDPGYERRPKLGLGPGGWAGWLQDDDQDPGR